MREIEFRAYSKSLKRMLSFEHLQEATKGMVDVANAEIQKRNMNYNKLAPYGLFLPLEDDDLEFMQYTGRTDKNDKKIFEGDIICYKIKQNNWDKIVCNKGIVVFKNGCFGIVDTLGRFTSFDGFCNTKFEIIGNIWENPEMIKESNNE